MIPVLSALLAVELSFVEAYDLAIAKTGDPYVRQQLEECQRSHQMRVNILREEIEDLGGDVDLSRREEAIALGTVHTEAAAIVRLHGLEQAGLKFYRTVGEKADFDVADLIEGDLLPEQERTHAIVSSLVAEEQAEATVG